MKKLYLARVALCGVILGISALLAGCEMNVSRPTDERRRENMEPQGPGNMNRPQQQQERESSYRYRNQRNSQY